MGAGSLGWQRPSLVARWEGRNFLGGDICVITSAKLREATNARSQCTDTHTHTTSAPTGPCQADLANEEPLENGFAGASLGTVWSGPHIINTPCS